MFRARRMPASAFALDRMKGWAMQANEPVDRGGETQHSLSSIDVRATGTMNRTSMRFPMACGEGVNYLSHFAQKNFGTISVCGRQHFFLTRPRASQKRGLNDSR